MSTILNSRESGWKAELKLGFTHSNNKTILSQRSHKGPLTVQRPFYPEGAVCHVYLLHPPGGIVAGDQLSIDVQVDNDAKALITTPGAGKFYPSAGQQALQTVSLKILIRKNLPPDSESPFKTRFQRNNRKALHQSLM